MLSPKGDSPKDESPTVILQVESNLSAASEGPPIGWNISKDGDSTMPSYLSEVHLSHQQITRRFGELLNLFEDYTKILKSEQERGSVSVQLKRVLSQVAIREGKLENKAPNSSAVSLKLAVRTMCGWILKKDIF